ncbi:MAG: hypothetical protein HZA35_00450 [Parcubacteria group bacterium]|nr:hypothetical protein [Parcubacteria group bacterium]
MTQRQKIIVLSISSFLLLVLGVFIYLLLNRKTTGTPQDTSTNTSGDQTTQIDTSPPSEVVFTQETENPVSVSTYRNNVLYFIDEAGALWEKQMGETTALLPSASSTESSSMGTPVRIGTFTVQDANAMFSSPNGTLLVGEGAVSAQKKFSLINPKTNSTALLPQGVREARFLSDAELVYYKDSFATTGIFIYDIAKKKERLIKSLSPLDIHIRLINKNLLMIAEKPTNGFTNLILSLNLQTKELKDYFSNFLGASLSVVGENRVLAFVQNPKDEDLNNLYNLVLLNESGKITHTLNITTIPEKCTIDNRGTYLYCAVPMEWSKNMPGLNLPDDYYKQATDFTEKIYRIDLITFTADEITPNARIEDAIFPSVSEDNSRLYFKNRKDGYIYSLVLPLAQ